MDRRVIENPPGWLSRPGIPPWNNHQETDTCGDKTLSTKEALIVKLQQEILAMQGFKANLENRQPDFGLGSIATAFPNHTFPTAAVHEFISLDAEKAAATIGFMAGLLSRLMEQAGACLWVSTQRTIFPPALTTFGIDPDRIIFVDLGKEKDLLWVMEEALKCNALAAVVGEIKEINLTESRRLQLAVEQSQVTGFLHRYKPRKMDNIACISRWKISPLTSELEAGMPGVGYPSWNVDLLKVRNGKPGSWQVQWVENSFRPYIPATTDTTKVYRKTG